MIRHNGPRNRLNPSHHDWDYFDNLPREKKEVVWYSPFRCTLSKKSGHLSIEQIRKGNARLAAAYCLSDYGPDHPSLSSCPAKPRLNP
jgi:hypothetical protein